MSGEPKGAVTGLKCVVAVSVFFGYMDAFYLLHHKWWQDNDWYYSFVGAVMFCMSIFGLVFLAVRVFSEEETEQLPNGANGTGVKYENPINDDVDDSDDADESVGNVPVQPDDSSPPELKPGELRGIPAPVNYALVLWMLSMVLGMAGGGTVGFSKSSAEVGDFGDVNEQVFTSMDSLTAELQLAQAGMFRLEIDGPTLLNETLIIAAGQVVYIAGIWNETGTTVPGALSAAPTLTGDGRAFRVAAGGELELEYITISNRAVDTSGAAVYVEAGGVLKANRCSFSALTATDGGAISSLGAVQVTNSWFSSCTAERTSNTAAPGGGGALELKGNYDLVEGCTFIGCTTPMDGGAIYVGDIDHFRLSRSNFFLCSAGRTPAGAAIYWKSHDWHGDSGAEHTEAPFCGGSLPGACWDNDYIMNAPLPEHIECAEGDHRCHH